jgi:excisionase family DNA binding protein
MTLKNKLTTKQATLASGLDRAELYRLLRSGTIRAERFGWQYLVERRSLEAYLKTKGKTLPESA